MFIVIMTRYQNQKGKNVGRKKIITIFATRCFIIFSAGATLLINRHLRGVSDTIRDSFDFPEVSDRKKRSLTVSTASIVSYQPITYHALRRLTVHSNRFQFSVNVIHVAYIPCISINPRTSLVLSR